MPSEEIWIRNAEVKLTVEVIPTFSLRRDTEEYEEHLRDQNVAA
jgi:hypothetical protein